MCWSLPVLAMFSTLMMEEPQDRRDQSQSHWVEKSCLLSRNTSLNLTCAADKLLLCQVTEFCSFYSKECCYLNQSNLAPFPILWFNCTPQLWVELKWPRSITESYSYRLPNWVSCGHVAKGCRVRDLMDFWNQHIEEHWHYWAQCTKPENWASDISYREKIMNFICYYYFLMLWPFSWMVQICTLVSTALTAQMMPWPPFSMRFGSKAQAISSPAPPPGWPPGITYPTPNASLYPPHQFLFQWPISIDALVFFWKARNKAQYPPFPFSPQFHSHQVLLISLLLSPAHHPLYPHLLVQTNTSSCNSLLDSL